METRAPIMLLCKEFLPDSAGAGRRRGGISQRIAFTNISDTPINARLRPDKMFCDPPGLNGGSPGRVGEVRFNGESLTRFPPLELKPGDVIELRMPGGGGFGPVAERERAQIEWDLEMGYITEQGAKEAYGYVKP
jgi:N-methylhydantoinase B